MFHFLLFHESFHVGELPVADEFDDVGSDGVVVGAESNIRRSAGTSASAR